MERITLSFRENEYGIRKFSTNPAGKEAFAIIMVEGGGIGFVVHDTATSKPIFTKIRYFRIPVNDICHLLNI